MTKQELENQISLLENNEAIRSSQMELNITQQKHTLTVCEAQIKNATIQLNNFVTENERAKNEYEAKRKELEKTVVDK